MKKIAFLVVPLLVSFAAPAKEYVLKSPDGKIVLTADCGEHVSYSVTRDGVKLLAPSQISMVLLDGTLFGAKDNFRVSRRSIDQTIPARNYKRTEVRDRFNEMTLSAASYDIVFRAYDDGVAYRFVSRSKDAGEFAVAYEQAEFAFPYRSSAYVSYVANPDEKPTPEQQYFTPFENTYKHHALTAWEKSRLAFLPLTVEGANGIKLCITESDLRDYPAMYLTNQEGGLSLRGVFPSSPSAVSRYEQQGFVRSRHNYLTRVQSPHAFPWRVVAIATEDRCLAESDLVWRLASPETPGDWSWVKPGKAVSGQWTENTLSGVGFQAGVNDATYKHYIDFAAENGIEYVVLGKGWTAEAQDDLMQVVPGIDLPALCQYAKEKGVGLVLWAGYWAFSRDMEAACRHYASLGVKGWVVDMLYRDDAEMVDFCEKAASVAAKNRMFIDFHGVSKPAGIQRTWPNVLNVEGVHGLEQMKGCSPEVDQVAYDVTIPFTRLVAGPADYRPGAMRNATRENYRSVQSEPMSQGTRCHQLAEYVVFDAPLTWLSDSPTAYRREAECVSFISSIPTVWDETVALDGRIGEYVVVARRSGAKWYVGALGNWEARDLEIDLSRLGAGTREGDAFLDGANADKIASDYRREKVSANGKWKVHLAPGGGAVLVL